VAADVEFAIVGSRGGLSDAQKLQARGSGAEVQRPSKHPALQRGDPQQQFRVRAGWSAWRCTIGHQLSCFRHRTMDSEGERQATAFKCCTDRSQSAIRFQLVTFRLTIFAPFVFNDVRAGDGRAARRNRTGGFHAGTISTSVTLPGAAAATVFATSESWRLINGQLPLLRPTIAIVRLERFCW
jgi:hypothetical protein